MSADAVPVSRVRLACKYAAEAMRQLAEHCNGELTIAEATRGLMLSAAGSTLEAARHDGVERERARQVFLDIAQAAWDEAEREGYVTVRSVGEVH